MSSEEAQTRCKFDLGEGSGSALKELPCFQTVGRRGKAATALESALDFVHSCVYGRRGVTGERRAALENFKGFPPRMEAEVVDKLKRQERAKLSAMAKALGVATSQAHTRDALAQAVGSFLMAPKDDGSFAAAAERRGGAKRPRQATAGAAARRSASQKRTRTTRTKSQPHARSPRRQSTQQRGGRGSPARRAAGRATASRRAPTKRATQSRHGRPSDEALQVVVYRRILGMTPDDRMQLGVKGLRTELEQHFALADGALRDRKMLIATTASECARALYEAEHNAITAMQEGILPPDVLPVADALLCNADQDDTPQPTPPDQERSNGEAAATPSAADDTCPPDELADETARRATPSQERLHTADDTQHHHHHAHHHNHNDGDDNAEQVVAHPQEATAPTARHTSRSRSPEAGHLPDAPTMLAELDAHSSAPALGAQDHRSVYESPEVLHPTRSPGRDAMHADSPSRDLYQGTSQEQEMADAAPAQPTRSPPHNLGYDASSGPQLGAGGLTAL